VLWALRSTPVAREPTRDAVAELREESPERIESKVTVRLGERHPASAPEVPDLEEGVLANCGVTDVDRIVARLPVASLEVRQLRWTLRGATKFWVLEQTRVSDGEIQVRLGSMARREDPPDILSEATFGGDAAPAEAEGGAAPLSYLTLGEAQGAFGGEWAEFRGTSIVETEETGRFTVYGRIFLEDGALRPDPVRSTTETTRPMAFQRRNGIFVSAAFAAQDRGRPAELLCSGGRCHCDP